MQIRHNRCVQKLNCKNISVINHVLNKLPFAGKSNFSVEDDKVDPTTVEFNKKITTEVQNLHVKKVINNLSKFEYKALLILGKNRDIVIKKADKGSITVVMDRSTYLQEGYIQLNNPQYYRKLD